MVEIRMGRKYLMLGKRKHPVVQTRIEIEFALMRLWVAVDWKVAVLHGLTDPEPSVIQTSSEAGEEFEWNK